jgi:hypothetical protein
MSLCEHGNIFSHCATCAPSATEQTSRPDVIEALSYHAFERNDMTLDEVVEVIRHGYVKVPGRTARQLELQLCELLAAAPAPAQRCDTCGNPEHGIAPCTFKPAPAEPVAEREAVISVLSRVLSHGLAEQGSGESKRAGALAQEITNLLGRLVTAPTAPRVEETATDLIDALEVYMVNGQPRFAVRDCPGGPDYFESARAAIDAARGFRMKRDEKP